MNSKRVGNIGEAFVLAKFVELGIPVYLPFGDNEKADMIIELHGKLLKVQIKTSESFNGETVTFRTCSQRGKTKEAVIYVEGDFDIYAFYCLITKQIYILSLEECPDKAVIFRFTPPKNNQTKNIRLAKDYTIENFILNAGNA
jgi:hypothetical protein